MNDQGCEPPVFGVEAVRSIACTAGFIARGLGLHPLDGGIHAFFEAAVDRGEGGVEAMACAMSWAVRIECINQAWQKGALAAGKDLDYPGVLDYEVSEPFGAWYAAQYIRNTLPDDDGIEEYLREQLREFFQRAMIDQGEAPCNIGIKPSFEGLDYDL